MSRKLVLIALGLCCLAILYAAPTIANACSGIAGDVNDDGAVTSADITFLYNYLFAGGPPPPCPGQADVDGDCDIDIADLVYLMNFMRNGGPAPRSCPAHFP